MDVFNMFFGGGGGGGGFGGAAGGGPRKSKPIMHNLAVSLEDLYLGKKKSWPSTGRWLVQDVMEKVAPRLKLAPRVKAVA